MAHVRHLGNDVVDLISARSMDPTLRPRFLQRVLHPEEEALVAASPDPRLALWLIWAGKEAIFKSTSKAQGHPPVFHHRRFQVFFAPHTLARLSPSSPPATSEYLLSGSGRYERFGFVVHARVTSAHIHAVAWLEESGVGPEPEVVWAAVRERESTGRGSPADPLEPRFTAREWRCVSHRYSALTRLAAREALSRNLGVEEKRLEIRCGPGDPGRRVPLVFLDQEPVPVDLTLSHDGPVLAWAFLPYRPQGR